MSLHERQVFAEEIAKAHASPPTGLIAVTGGLVLAKLSGFGLYIAASTSLAALANATGVTLPFAVYTGMSGILAAAVGPAGWLSLGAVAVYQLGGANYKKTIPGVIAVASARARLVSERAAEVAQLANRRAELDHSGALLDNLARFIEEMKRTGVSQVPRTSVPS